MARNIDMAELLEEAIEDRITDTWTMLPAKVQTYDAVKQCADVVPLVRRPLLDTDDELTQEELPILPNVPVLFTRGGGFAVTHPLSPGDAGIVIFSTLSFAAWRVTGSVSDTTDTRTHGIGNGVFLPGLVPENGTLAQSATNAFVIDGPEIRLGANASDFVALASKVDAKIAALALDVSSITATAISHPNPYTNPGSVAATKAKAE